jgi:hypothetical protein
MSEGKYDSICTKVREETKAAFALVIVLGGDKGEGFSLQMDAARVDPKFMLKVPTFLRNVADGVEKQLKEGGVKVESKSR